VDDLEKTLSVSVHLPIECHVPYKPGARAGTLRLDLSALKEHG
jgi:hypothetical protein